MSQEAKETKPKITSVLNGFTVPSVIFAVIAATWFVRPYFDKVDQQNLVNEKTTAAVDSLSKITADLQRRVEGLEKAK